MAHLNESARPAIVLVLMLLGVAPACRPLSPASGPAYSRPGRLHPKAPPETAHLGQLVGEWKAVIRARRRDGSWSPKTSLALWRWYYILDGHAIQDDWMPAGRGGLQTAKPWGTNIRIYNPKARRWGMAWIGRRRHQLSTFTATSTPGKIVMTGRDGFGRLSRITFFAIEASSFRWTKDWTRNGGKTWFPVARIRCARVTP